MITLNKQLCEQLNITYWQLRQDDEKESIYHISLEEKELLRNILLAKGIQLQDDLFTVEKDGVVRVVANNKIVLLFNDVNHNDTSTHINLAKLSDMQKDQQLKKLTWFKLKNLNF